MTQFWVRSHNYRSMLFCLSEIIMRVFSILVQFTYLSSLNTLILQVLLIRCWKLQREMAQPLNPISTGVVKLNVGGSLYTTTTSTLAKSNSRAFDRVSNDVRVQAPYCDLIPFFDRDGPTFRHVLNFLRNDRLMLPGDFHDYDLLENEARFYKIENLVKCVREARSSL